MCGVAGVYGAELDPAVGQQILASLAHRGPDGSGVFEDPSARLTLFHTRLAVLDPSPDGRQPMSAGGGRHVLTFNGEIYNFRQLRERLRARGHAFRTGTDTEVLLALYAEEGEHMLGHLDGIFAFALWDRPQQRLLLARDPSGVKPLYTLASADAFAFASELKALLPLPLLRPALDLQALAHYARYLWCPSPRSPMRGVDKMRPGEAMLVHQGRVERRWSFAPEPADHGPDMAVRPDERAGPIAQRVRDALAAAVERQMVADVPLGAFLSGGLDSSAIAAFARRHASGRLQCFTIDFSAELARAEGVTRDLPFAERVARHLDVDLHVVRVGPEIAAELPRMIWHLDEPQADLAGLNVLLISRLARQHGIKVLLSGAGGDDIFSGYRRHRALALEPLWSRIPAALRRHIAALAEALPAGPAPLRRAHKLLTHVGLDPDARLAGYFEWQSAERIRALFRPEHRPALTDEPLLDALAAMPAGLSPLQRALRLEQRYFLAEHNLNYTDKMSMAAGVETRVPFLDPALIRLAAGVPDRHRVHAGQTKWILKQAMRGLLPPEILHRPKTGFGVPLRAWLRGPLRPLLHDLLAPAAIARRGVFEPHAVARLLADHESGRGDHAYSLLALICVEIWCRQFLDGQGRPTPA
jgi:asparagine synthase (glutamine-hydrolysing)